MRTKLEKADHNIFDSALTCADGKTFKRANSGSKVDGASGSVQFDASGTFHTVSAGSTIFDVSLAVTVCAVNVIIARVAKSQQIILYSLAVTRQSTQATGLMQRVSADGGGYNVLDV